MESLTPTELAARLKAGDPIHLLDVRQPEEFAIAAIPGAILIPLDTLPGRLAEIESWKDAEVVVSCHHGMRSAHAIAWLRAQGFTKLLNLTGGIDRWSIEVDPGVPRY